MNVEKVKRVMEEVGKEELFEKVYRIGFELERTRYVCAQCVVGALEKIFGIENKAILQAAYPLGGGFGSTTQGTCGALSGGGIFLGYLYGRTKEEFEKCLTNRKATFLAKKLYDKFVKEYGSCRCRDVQEKIFGRSFDFWNEKDKEAFEKAGGHTDKCPDVVGKTCAMCVEVIWEEIFGKDTGQ